MTWILLLALLDVRGAQRLEMLPMASQDQCHQLATQWTDEKLIEVARLRNPLPSFAFCVRAAVIIEIAETVRRQGGEYFRLAVVAASARDHVVAGIHQMATYEECQTASADLMRDRGNTFAVCVMPHRLRALSDRARALRD